MSTWLVVWLIATLTTTVALAAFVAALVRHGLVVGRSAKRMQEEIAPLAEDISRETAAQQRRLSTMRVPGRRSGRS